jgi:ATP-binding cassette, subfamily B, bacterial PglK
LTLGRPGAENRARAGVLKKAAILVLREATSALDAETEGAVMDAICASSRDVTVLIIAHRLTTLRTCDRVSS